MPRALFEKTGNAIFISHLDLMRLFQRAFKRAGLHLTPTQGYNPRPSVSMALPLSLGMESKCELMDFELEGDIPENDEVLTRLNQSLISGVRVLSIYDNASKIKNLSFLDCILTLEYDDGVPERGKERIEELFQSKQLLLEKKSKNVITEQDIIPMVKRIQVEVLNEKEIALRARVCCQNPALNPMQLYAAIIKFLPELAPNHVRCCREEIYDTNETVFR